jgi:hypothetical protein
MLKIRLRCDPKQLHVSEVPEKIFGYPFGTSVSTVFGESFCYIVSTANIKGAVFAGENVNESTIWNWWRRF